MRYKKKKAVRLRGSTTHGWGAKKKHRGAGHRGGRGNAGSGKRADQKKPSIWKEHYFGQIGFHSIKEKGQAVNLQYLEEKTDSLIAVGIMRKEGDFFAIDTERIGCDKLLSKGTVTRKYKIKCKAATEQAVEKVKKMGGEVITSG
jgi:large subunit ribosomal protein L15